MSDDQQQNNAREDDERSTPRERADGFKSDESKDRVLADLRAEREKRQALEAKLREHDDKDKSESERLTARLADAEKRATDAESKALRFEVASAKGLTHAQAKRLVGSTKDELEADADELLETFGGAGNGGKPPTRKPVENLRGGSEPDEEPEETDPTKLAALHPRGTY